MFGAMTCLSVADQLYTVFPFVPESTLHVVVDVGGRTGMLIISSNVS